MKNIILYSLFAFIIFASSCTEVIQVDIPASADRLVVEGYVSTEKDSSYVQLSKTVSYFSTSVNPFVNNAFVKVNNDTFFYTINGIYRPHAGYTGIVNTPYYLTVNYSGKTYSSLSILNPLIKIDSTFKFIYHEKELIAAAGYSVSFNFMFHDANQYTYFRDGFNSPKSLWRDSLYSQLVTFDSKSTKYNELIPFDVPLLRLNANDTVLLMFRSCDLNAFNYYNALSDMSRGGSPFSNPPANLPTNITGGAVGLFAAQEVRHFRIRIAP